MGYAKLFSSIIHSTIWREPDHVRIVWVTMLAISDQYGIVECSIPGLADAARVNLQQCVEALNRLQSPDIYSRCPDNEGRRIEKIDGGFEIINYEKYRDKATADEKRERNAEKQKRWRERQKSLPTVTGNNHALPTVTGNNQNNQNNPLRSDQLRSDQLRSDQLRSDQLRSDQIQEEGRKTKTRAQARGTRAQARSTTLTSTSTDFDLFWKTYPKKIGKGAARKAWNKAASARPELEKVRAAIEAQCKSEQWVRDGGQFIPNPATWLNQGRWDDEPAIGCETRAEESKLAASQRRSMEAMNNWLKEDGVSDEKQTNYFENTCDGIEIIPRKV